MKTSLSLLLAYLLASQTFAENPLERGQRFLKSVFTDPATENSHRLLYGEFVSSIALSYALEKMEQSQLANHQKSIKNAEDLRGQLELNEFEISTTREGIESIRSDIEDLSRREKFLKEYVNDPHRALTNLEGSLIERTKNIASERSKTTDNRVIANLLKEESDVSVQLKEVKDSMDGNRIPASIQNHRDIVALSREIEYRKEVLSDQQERLESLEREGQGISNKLAKKTNALVRGKSFTIRGAVFKGVGVLANLFLLADAAGNFYVINVLDRDPQVSSIATLARSPRVAQKVNQLLKKQSP